MRKCRATALEGGSSPGTVTGWLELSVGKTLGGALEDDLVEQRFVVAQEVAARWLLALRVGLLAGATRGLAVDQGLLPEPGAPHVPLRGAVAEALARRLKARGRTVPLHKGLR